MEDIVIVEPKDYEQVVFEDVQEYYYENEHLECLFSVSELLNIEDNDFVGIYKVGFKTSKDYFTTQSVNRLCDNKKHKVVFDSEKLPKEDGEYYQFVYISNGKTRGASIPFQFKTKTIIEDSLSIEKVESIESLESIELDKSEIERKILQIKEEFKKYNNFYEIYTKNLQENEDLISMLLENELSIVVTTIMENDKPKEIGKEISENSNKTNVKDKKSLVEMLKRYDNELDMLSYDLELLEKEEEDLKYIFEKRIIDVLKAEKKDEIYENEEIKNINVYLKIILSKFEVIMAKIIENTKKLVNMKSDIRKVSHLSSSKEVQSDNQLVDSNFLPMIPKINDEKLSDEPFSIQILQKFASANEKLLAAEHCKELLREQLALVTNELEVIKINSKLNDEIIMNEKRLADENKNLIIQINKVKEEFEKKLDDLSGSYYALTIANQHLENRIKQSDETYLKEIEKQRSEILLLKEENERLRDKFAIKSFDYELINKKYNELKGRFSNEMTMSVRKDDNDLMSFEPLNNTETAAVSTNGNDESDAESVYDNQNNIYDSVDAYIKSSINTNIREMLSTIDFESKRLLDLYHKQKNYISTNGMQNEADKLNLRKENKNECDVYWTIYEDINNNNENNNRRNDKEKNNEETKLIEVDESYLNFKKNENLEIARENKLQKSEIYENNFIDVNRSSDSRGNENENLNIFKSSQMPSNGIEQIKPISDINYNYSNDLAICNCYDYDECCCSICKDGSSCPVCLKRYPDWYPREYFEIHISSHFPN